MQIVSQQGIKGADTIDELVWANTYVSVQARSQKFWLGGGETSIKSQHLNI